MATERKATAEALRREGRPNATFTVPSVSPEALGELMMLFQVATVYGGALYGVDPLDQPGVELSKKLTYGLMGRDGAEAPDISLRIPAGSCDAAGGVPRARRASRPPCTPSPEDLLDSEALQQRPVQGHPEVETCVTRATCPIS
jgi:hypothetical protein